MPAGNVASSLALQKEYVVPKLEKLALAGSRLWKYIKLNTKIKPVSNRPVRVPLQPLTAGKFRVGNFDGGDMGLGSGPQTVPGTLSCVSFVQASQWTAQAEYTTDSDEKAIEDFAKVVELKPDFAEAFHLRGISYEYSGDMDSAIEDYKKALELKPNFTEAKSHLDAAKSKAEGGGEGGEGDACAVEGL